ncbi:hypothetical protein K458DRAFT_420109 [Lentithecium fluviatile CBS 122367]|uniref:Uncharacterized protein n=1 Tax=Lentithecium fluviatile CBS 122367 TaxID=1168545 RepID=A0A6G1IV97_9PLEO|nr:hypothetical protein K458DRAFT_420109 [Lentithecium fluviatile CBS 122367]
MALPMTPVSTWCTGMFIHCIYGSESVQRAQLDQQVSTLLDPQPLEDEADGFGSLMIPSIKLGLEAMHRASI